MKYFKMLIVVLMLSFVVFIPSSNAINLSNVNVGVIRTELPTVEDVNVCVSDVAGHKEIVAGYVHKYFEGNIRQMEFSDDYDIRDYRNCQVINYSIGIFPLFFGFSKEERKIMLENFKKEEYETLDSFLKSYKGIVVEAAGNEDDDAKTSSPLARYKSKNKDKTVQDRLFVVGQIEIDENGNYIHHFSDGDEVDFVVPNYNEYLKGERYNGTSFAAPVVSGVLATLLKAGIPQEDLRGVIGYEEKEHIWNGKSYKVFSVFKTFQNAYTYLENKKPLE